MKCNIEYYFTRTAVGELAIEDAGNCFISANNDNGQFYFLGIRTKLGITRVVEYGPYMDGLVVTALSSSFQQFEYNDKRIEKIIYTFVNSPGRNITQAIELTEDDFKQQLTLLKNPMEFLYDNN